MASQQGGQNFKAHNVKKIPLPEATIDSIPYRSGLYNMSRNAGSFATYPDNFWGQKTFKRPPLDVERTYSPGGVYGVYRYNGPTMQVFPIDKKYQI